MAFGGINHVQPYKVGGKEFDKERALNWLDFGAREYDGALGRFLTVDPMAEKYPNVSPYLYCKGNPMKYVDPDGRKVYFANGVSEQFKKDFSVAVQYLNTNKQGGMLAKLQASDKIYYVAEGVQEASSNFNKSNQTITWSSRTGVLTNNGVEMSPTTVLNHEVDHALRYDTNPKQQKTDAQTTDSQYENKEERRVITGSEQRTAKGLGEIKKDEVTRTDHGGTLHETTGPTKTDWKYEIIITPDEKKR
jgi:RHS repeat-associated protein